MTEVKAHCLRVNGGSRMAVSLKWKGNELFLGKTKMAEVRPLEGHWWEYVIGAEDRLSEPYQSKEDCRQDCETVVRDMLAQAGA
jgi:hypothetical protein